MASIDNDEMAVILVDVALIARLVFNAATGGKRKNRYFVGVCLIKSRTLVKGDKWSLGVGLHNPDAEVDLHLSTAPEPAPLTRKPVNDSVGLGIERRVAYVLRPDGAGRKVRCRSDGVLQLGGLHRADMVMIGKTGGSQSDRTKGNVHQIPFRIHNSAELLKITPASLQGAWLMSIAAKAGSTLTLRSLPASSQLHAKSSKAGRGW